MASIDDLDELSIAQRALATIAPHLPTWGQALQVVVPSLSLLWVIAHPIGALTLAFAPVELTVVAAVFAIETVLGVLLAAPLLGYPSLRWRPAKEPDVELRHDGFSGRWLAWPATVKSVEAFTFALLLTVFTVPFSWLWAGTALHLSGLLQGPSESFLGLAAFTLSLMLGAMTFLSAAIVRSLVNLTRSTRWVDVHLEGRTLTVNGRRWHRQADDRVVKHLSRVELHRDGERLVVRGGPDEVSWLAEMLRQSRPEPDGGQAPAALDALRRRQRAG